jgi:hypothetical protein
MVTHVRVGMSAALGRPSRTAAFRAVRGGSLGVAAAMTVLAWEPRELAVPTPGDDEESCREPDRQFLNRRGRRDLDDAVTEEHLNHGR